MIVIGSVHPVHPRDGGAGPGGLLPSGVSVTVIVVEEAPLLEGEIGISVLGRDGIGGKGQEAGQYLRFAIGASWVFSPLAGPRDRVVLSVSDGGRSATGRMNPRRIDRRPGREFVSRKKGRRLPLHNHRHVPGAFEPRDPRATDRPAPGRLPSRAGPPVPRVLGNRSNGTPRRTRSPSSATLSGPGSKAEPNDIQSWEPLI